jgi:hypothetical protein
VDPKGLDLIRDLTAALRESRLAHAERLEILERRQRAAEKAIDRLQRRLRTRRKSARPIATELRDTGGPAVN